MKSLSSYLVLLYLSLNSKVQFDVSPLINVLQSPIDKRGVTTADRLDPTTVELPISSPHYNNEHLFLSPLFYILLFSQLSSPSHQYAFFLMTPWIEGAKLVPTSLRARAYKKVVAISFLLLSYHKSKVIKPSLRRV
jgi:hypothetical protein